MHCIPIKPGNHTAIVRQDVVNSMLIVSLAISSDDLALHRFQLSIFLAIATTLAVGGVEFIFQTPGAYIAIGVGWLLLTMVNVSSRQWGSFGLR